MTNQEMKIKKLLRRPYSRLLVADSETGRFIGRIVEFSGCFAEGDTAEEAARNLEAAAESWLTAVIERGQVIPEPTGSNEYSGKFVIRIPRSLHSKCAQYASNEGVSLNQFVIYALAQHCGDVHGGERTLRQLSWAFTDSPRHENSETVDAATLGVLEYDKGFTTAENSLERGLEGRLVH